MPNSAPSTESQPASGLQTPCSSDACDRLPDEIIQQILCASDPNVFASLVLLNRKWREVSQQPDLYHLQLARCASYTSSHPQLPLPTDENLPELRSLFAREVKRNLFEAYLRPSKTVIKLVSTAISSSSCPGGEGMQFSASPRGHHILAFNSSRIFVIDVRGHGYQVSREFKISRRPVSACIKDDGSTLAVLSTEMQVDLYTLEASPPRHQQSVVLDNKPQTIALSPCGSVIAAAYSGGIEVLSLDAGALSSDKRAVKCDSVDVLSFSFDGTQILGTTTHSISPNTVILTAPYYDPGPQVAENNVSAMWTTSILFPNSSRDCSHAVLLQDGVNEEACWTFTYDRSFETFRAVRVEDLRNGTTYFTGPAPQRASGTKLLPSALPAATFHGDMVASCFQGKEIWVYGVPRDLDAAPEIASPTVEAGSTVSGPRRHSSTQSTPSRRPSTRNQDASSDSVPQWQILGDKLRNTLVAGAKVAELHGASAAKWVADYQGSRVKERLVIGCRGVTESRLVTDEEDLDFVDGGRITLLDFDYGLGNGTETEVTIEVGSDKAEVLQEEKRDIDAEVAIVRRRTVAQQRGSRTALLRAASTGAGRSLDVPVPPIPQEDDTDDDPLVPRRIRAGASNASATAELDGDEHLSIEDQEALDAPYAHASPRSGTTLRRAATAVAVNRRLNPRLADGRPIEYRRADGRAEHPHESDADNWVPPPPPYQKEDPGDLPAFLRGQSGAPSMPVPSAPQAGPAESAQSSAEKPVHPNVPRAVLYEDMQRERGPEPLSRRFSRQRTASDSTAMGRPVLQEAARPMSSPSPILDAEDLYGATPPQSPRHQHIETRPAPLNPSDDASMPASDVMESPQEASMVNASPTDDEERPTLGLQIPGSELQSSPESAAPAPVIRRLSNAQTWPSAPQTNSSGSEDVLAGYPKSATVMENTAADNWSATLPPLPSSSQIESLSKRVSQGNPRRLSGSMMSRRPVGNRPASHIGNQQENTPTSATSSSSWQSEPDQPLIISTPQGVAGAFDLPGLRSSLGGSTTPILAPVPRHPRSALVAPPIRRPVERLETIYSTRSSQAVEPAAPAGMSQPVARRSATQLLTSWLSPTTPKPRGKGSSGISRRPSRAERSAAKNMLDAKKKGWKGKDSRQRMEGGVDGESREAGWTDVSAPPSGKKKEKEKKCVVM